MRNTILLLSSLAILLILDGCKYPEGPILSLNSATARISRSWEVVEALDKDSVDVSESFENTFTFTESQDVFANIEILQINTDFEGTWDLDNDDTEFELELRDNFTGLIRYDKSYEILRLTQEEFWIMDQSDSTTIRLEAN